MRLDLEQRAVVDDLLTEAHAESADADGRFTTASVARTWVRKLHELEGSGHAWVSEFIDALAIDGARRHVAEWKRKHSSDVATSRGAAVTMQNFIGIRRTVEGGATEWVQVPLAGLALAELEELLGSHVSKRDTFSREITYMRDLARTMRTQAFSTAGEAAEYLREAS